MVLFHIGLQKTLDQAEAIQLVSRVNYSFQFIDFLCFRSSKSSLPRRKYSSPRIEVSDLMCLLQYGQKLVLLQVRDLNHAKMKVQFIPIPMRLFAQPTTPSLYPTILVTNCSSSIDIHSSASVLICIDAPRSFFQLAKRVMWLDNRCVNVPNKGQVW